jgi:hypothetical protein
MRLPSGFWPIVIAVAVVTLVACGQDRPQHVSRTTEAAPRVELRSEASLTVLEGQLIGREIRELTALPKELALRPNRSIRLLAAAFDQHGLPIETDIQFQWKVADPRAGSIEPGTDPNAPPLFRASGETGEYPDALIVSALVPAPSGFTGTSRHVKVTVAGDPPPPTIVEVEAIPPVIEAVQGQVVRLQAVGYDWAGRIVPQTRFDWQTATSDIGTINRLGYLTVSASPGEYRSAVRVVGEANNSKAEAVVTVRVVEPRAVSNRPTAHILPVNARIITGTPFKFQAVTLDAAGRPLRVVNAKWVVHDAKAGTIAADGSFVAGKEPGTYPDAVEYLATTSGTPVPATVSARATVTVRPVVLPNPLATVEAIPGHLLLAGGETFILRAIATDAGDRITGGVTIEWQVLDPVVGSVDTYGQFKAGRTPGTFADSIRVVARQQTPNGAIEVESLSSVTITGQMTTLEIVPANATVKAGQAIQFRAIARDENGVQIPGVLLDWSVAESTAGRIGLGGLFEAGKTPGTFPGAIRVRATQRLGR